LENEYLILIITFNRKRFFKKHSCSSFSLSTSIGFLTVIEEIGILHRALRNVSWDWWD